MRISATITTALIASALVVTPVSAQGHGAHGKPTLSPAKVPHSTAKPVVHTAKPTSHTTTKPGAHATPKTKPTSSTKPSAHAAAKSKSTRATTPAPATTTTMNPIAAKIASHPQLEAKVMRMVPAGMTLDEASKGFRNQGQFIAALHAADHMGCATCFAQIKTDMVDKGMSLGQSIQDVRHTNSTTAQTQAATAERETETDLKTTSTTTSTSTATTRKKPHTGSE